jgi:tRNA threonylcarbamoyl adenosine modification protein (Sua5/YciO/YrdC/YwlC family)
MSAELFKLHSVNPEERKIKTIVEKLHNGAVMLYPTDTGFTLGCELGNKSAIEKLRKIRKISDKKALTFLCHDLSNISEYAMVSNLAYKTLKRLIPGPYTFILSATKQVPKLAMHPTRKTTGIRVPDCIISQAIIAEMGCPIISITAKIETNNNGDDIDFAYLMPDEIVDVFYKLVDVVVTSDDYNFQGESTVIDMVTDDFQIIREGAGIEDVLNIIDIY